MLEESHATHRDGGSGRKLLPRQDVTPLPCPLPVPGSLPWSLGWVLQAHPLGCACYVCVGRTCPAGVVNSFSPCGPNLPHLSLCPFKLLAATPFAEHSGQQPHRPSWTQPVTSRLPVCKKRICRERSVSMTLFCPLCVPLHLQHPAGLPKPSPFHLQSCDRKALSESGSSVLPRESEKDR